MLPFYSPYKCTDAICITHYDIIMPIEHKNTYVQ